MMSLADLMIAICKKILGSYRLDIAHKRHDAADIT